MSSKFDFVLYGASGYTGKLVAEHLIKHHGNTVSIALAGRNLARLAEVRDAIGVQSEVALIAADAHEQGSLLNMVKQAKIVLSTVGPYQIHGSDLVAACAKEGVDYLDINAEAPWARRMIDLYDGVARGSGARILFSCGFISAPSELGVRFLQDAAVIAFGERFSHISCRVRKFKAGFSGGSVVSLSANLEAANADPSVAALLSDPFALTPGFHGPARPLSREVAFDSDLNLWTFPFPLEHPDVCNVHRSNFLQQHLYGLNFTYDEMMVTGPGEEGEMVARSIVNSGAAPWGDNIPKPGEGPSKAEREAGAYDLLFIGKNAKGAELRAFVSANSDPGYSSTSKMLAETAVCLMKNGKDVPGGIWTPGAALGRSLINRLKTHAGLMFAMERTTS